MLPAFHVSFQECFLHILANSLYCFSQIFPTIYCPLLSFFPHTVYLEGHFILVHKWPSHSFCRYSIPWSRHNFNLTSPLFGRHLEYFQSSAISRNAVNKLICVILQMYVYLKDKSLEMELLGPKVSTVIILIHLAKLSFTPSPKTYECFLPHFLANMVFYHTFGSL